MREKPNEWVSIADLMAGVVAVVMLLFVVAVMQIRAGTGSLEACKKLVRASESKTKEVRGRVGEILVKMRASIAQRGLEGLVEVDVDSQKITFRDGAFDSGSACIKPESSKVFLDVEKQTSLLLKSISEVEIYVDGHADATPAGDSTDKKKKCAYYNDNYTLSAARANEVRKQLINKLSDDAVRNRIIVTGYGDSRLLVTDDPTNPRNRRVELRIAVPPDPLNKVDSELLNLCLDQ